MEYADQNSGAIRLYLTLGELDMNQFLILKREAFVWKDFHIEFGILGESHFVTFTYQGEKLNEVCACTEAIIPDPSKLLEYDYLPNLHHAPLTHNFLAFKYSFDFTYMSEGEGAKRLEALRKKEKKEGVYALGYTFPKQDNEHDHAVTELYIDTTDDRLPTYSVHTYPNEHMMVFTESALVV